MSPNEFSKVSLGELLRSMQRVFPRERMTEEQVNTFDWFLLAIREKLRVAGKARHLAQQVISGKGPRVSNAKGKKVEQIRND